MKKQIILITVILLQLISSFTVSTDDLPYIIEGDSVYIDDPYVFLNVTPHTIIEDTDVEFQLLSKVYTGDIDIALGINSETMSPKNPRLWDGDSWEYWDVDFDTYSYEFEGFDKWYVATNLPIVQDQLYKLKIFIDIIFNTSGKYYFAVKPSGETLSQSIANGHFYYIDPWWNSSFQYNYVVEIDNTYIDTHLNGFPVYIPINTTVSNLCQAGGADIRFVSWDNTTEFPYEIVNWSTTHDSEVWVNVTNISSDKTTTINIYYGTPGAVQKSNPYGTWDASKYLAVWHCNDEGTLGDSTKYNKNGSKTGSPIQVAGKLGYAIEFNSDGQYYTISEDCNLSSDDFTIEAWYYNTSTQDENRYIFSKRDASSRGYELYIRKQTNGFPPYVYLRDADGTEKTGGLDSWCLIENAWNYINLSADNTKNKAFYELNNGFKKTTIDITGLDDINSTIKLRVGHSNAESAADFRGRIDELRLSKVKHNESWLKAQYNNINNTGNFLTIKGSVTEIIENRPLVNATTYINLTNATLNGWIGDTGDAGDTFRYGFWISDEFPATEQNKLQNITSGTNTVSANSTFSLFVGNLTSGETYYVKSWVWNNSGSNPAFPNSSNNISFIAGDYPTAPSNVETTIYDNLYVEINWTKGTGADKTVIIRKLGDYPTSVSDGTLIFNNTNASFRQSVEGQYFYRMWSWNDTWDVFSQSGTDAAYGGIYINCYDEETLGALTFDVLVSNLNGSETYRSKDNTNTFVIDISDTPQGPKTSFQISANESYSNNTETFVGGQYADNSTSVFIYLSNAPDSKAETNVTCYNATGTSESYPAFDLNGNEIVIVADSAPEFSQINVTYVHRQYYDRYFYFDIVENSFYTINAYLPRVDDSNLYVATVFDENDLPVQDANVTIRRYLDGEYQNLSITFTDAYGNTEMYLYPSIEYKVIIEKPGYTTEEAVWKPDPDYFGILYPKIFKIISIAENITIETFGDVCLFNASWETTNNTLFISFLDKNSQTTDATFRTYELYGNTTTLKSKNETTSLSEVYLWIASLNTSRMHRIDIEMNHTGIGYQYRSIVVMPLRTNRTTSTTLQWLESMFDDVLGEWDYGYVNLLLIYIPAMLILLAFGAAGHPGYGVMGSGIYCFFVTWYVAFDIETKIIALASILLILGFISLLANKRRVKR